MPLAYLYNAFKSSKFTLIQTQSKTNISVHPNFNRIKFNIIFASQYSYVAVQAHPFKYTKCNLNIV